MTKELPGLLVSNLFTPPAGDTPSHEGAEVRRVLISSWSEAKQTSLKLETGYTGVTSYLFDNKATCQDWRSRAGKQLIRSPPSCTVGWVHIWGELGILKVTRCYFLTSERFSLLDGWARNTLHGWLPAMPSKTTLTSISPKGRGGAQFHAFKIRAAEICKTYE